MSNKPKDRTLKLKKARTKKKEGIVTNPVAKFAPLFNKARRYIDKKKKLKNTPPLLTPDEVERLKEEYESFKETAVIEEQVE